MSDYTPGPWISDEEEGTPFVAAELGPNTYQMLAVMSLCTVHGIAAGQTEMRANARLIATAPDLLEALSDLAFRLRADGRMADMAALDKAYAVIAKATGVQR